jgi:hypothetical protein
VLGVNCDEVQSRIHSSHADQGVAALRRCAVNLLICDASHKLSKYAQR